MNEDLVRKAREYASQDDYVVTRRYISSLCDEIDRLVQLNKNVFSRIQDNKEVWNNAERYLWLRNSAWDVGLETVAPIVVNCDNVMEKFEWVEGSRLDKLIDEWRNKK
jgi:hypothetical protein